MILRNAKSFPSSTTSRTSWTTKVCVSYDSYVTACYTYIWGQFGAVKYWVLMKFTLVSHPVMLQRSIDGLSPRSADHRSCHSGGGKNLQINDSMHRHHTSGDGKFSPVPWATHEWHRGQLWSVVANSFGVPH